MSCAGFIWLHFLIIREVFFHAIFIAKIGKIKSTIKNIAENLLPHYRGVCLNPRHIHFNIDRKGIKLYVPWKQNLVLKPF
jgi:hypothetical protein